MALLGDGVGVEDTLDIVCREATLKMMGLMLMRCLGSRVKSSLLRGVLIDRRLINSVMVAVVAVVPSPSITQLITGQHRSMTNGGSTIRGGQRDFFLLHFINGLHIVVVVAHNERDVKLKHTWLKCIVFQGITVEGGKNGYEFNGDTHLVRSLCTVSKAER